MSETGADGFTCKVTEGDNTYKKTNTSFTTTYVNAIFNNNAYAPSYTLKANQKSKWLVITADLNHTIVDVEQGDTIVNIPSSGSILEGVVVMLS